MFISYQSRVNLVPTSHLHHVNLVSVSHLPHVNHITHTYIVPHNNFVSTSFIPHVDFTPSFLPYANLTHTLCQHHIYLMATSRVQVLMIVSVHKLTELWGRLHVPDFPVNIASQPVFVVVESAGLWRGLPAPQCHGHSAHHCTEEPQGSSVCAKPLRDRDPGVPGSGRHHPHRDRQGRRPTGK